MLKLPALLAQYLYAHQRLDLPGIGSFRLEGNVVASPDNSRSGKAQMLEGVTFESNPGLRESPELVQYIATETGKIKALAAADLDSHLGLALQFINIGKPFMFEGIGSITKSQKGIFSFTPGEIIPEKVKELHIKTEDESVAGENYDGYKAILYGKRKMGTVKAPVVLLLVLLGIGLAIWGGYTVYRKGSGRETALVADSNDLNNRVTILDDTTIAIKSSDTLTSTPPAASYAAAGADPGITRFLLEKADSPRAHQRFGKLKSYGWNVQLERVDSHSYKLLLLMQTPVVDTLRILDSLTSLNGKKVAFADQ